MKSNIVLIAGAGTMGCGIAAICARAGFRVLLHDQVASARDASLERVRTILENLAAERIIESSEIDQGLSSIDVCVDLESARDAFFVIECVPEALELKRSVLGTLESAVPSDAILATNSSSFTLGQLGTNVRRPERFLATHFYNPAHVIPLVEVGRSGATADWAIDQAFRFLRALGKVPVRCGDSSGYIAVRLQMALVNEAIAMLEQGVATAEDIDTAVRSSFGLRLATMGPLEMADRGGLDVWLNAGDSLYRTYGNPKFEPPRLLREKVADGHLGVKTGSGLHGDVAMLLAAGRDRQLLRLVQYLGLLPRIGEDIQ